MWSIISTNNLKFLFTDFYYLFTLVILIFCLSGCKPYVPRYSTICDCATPLLYFIECTCLHPDGANHNPISRENRGIWEGLRASAAILHQQRAGLVLLRCAVVSCDITQPCAVALFSFNAAGILTMAYHSLLRFFMGGFYFQWGQLQF